MSEFNYSAVGKEKAIIVTSLGVFLSYIILIFMGLVRLLVDFFPNISIGLGTTYFIAWYFGGKAGKLILAKERKQIWVGILLALVSVFIGTVMGTSVTFFAEAVQHGRVEISRQDITSYIVSPLFWVMSFGIIPAIGLGIFYTYLVKKSQND